ncbi:MAG: hypothetical protein DMF41_05565 [Verrucomicrobia bacterium]|nr:MAG: hypothetical protein DMF41_05565 [Verrucomicrobiota bacterium]
MKILLLSVALAVTTLPLLAQTPPPAALPSPSPAKPPADYDLRWAVKIPMRDKVELNATFYLPKTSDGSPPKTPAIFTLTPYISDTYHARAAYFASHGYVFALVDVRGRGNSGGEFEPFAQEPRDGHDAVEINNVGETYDVQWLTLTSGRAGQQNLSGDQKFWRSKFLDAYKKHIAFKTLDSFVGNPSANFQRILKHPTADSYYDAMVPTREQFQKITLPILTITGQYDGDELEGTDLLSRSSRERFA